MVSFYTKIALRNGLDSISSKVQLLIQFKSLFIYEATNAKKNTIIVKKKKKEAKVLSVIIFCKLDNLFHDSGLLNSQH